MSASRDARAAVYTDVSAITGPVGCVACGSGAVQRVSDVCSPSLRLDETAGGFVACFPGEHLKDAFAAPRSPERPQTTFTKKWFVAAAASVPVMAGLLRWNLTAGAAASALPIVSLAIGAIDYRRDRFTRLSHQAAETWHQEELRFWHRLYYCHACGQVFVPNHAISTTPDQWRKLMV